MKLKSILLGAAFAALGLAATTGASANANAYLFGYTYSPYVYGPQELIINGSTVVQAELTGWYDLTGSHSAGNPDYIVGNCSIGTCGGAGAYNDFFTFDLSNVSGPITSAVLSAGNPSIGYSGASSATYSLYDVTTAVATVESSNSGATAIYNDLGSGVFYGSVGVGPFDNGANVVVTLDANALAALTAAEGGKFAIGGTLGTYTAAPEPAAWVIMLLGLGGVGGAMRRRRAITATA